MKTFFSLLSLLITVPAAAGDKTPVVLAAVQNQIITGEGEDWTPPEYSGQRLKGYHKEDFLIVPEMENQIRFWIDIYSKYDSNRGVIHDADHIDLIYEVVNFPPMEGTPQEIHEIKKIREKRVKEAKERAKELLDSLQARLDRGGGEEGLSGKKREVWRALASEKSRKKFKEAKDRSRLRMQLGQKDQFQLGIYYSGRYLDRIEEIFAKYSLPQELTRLPLVESSFNILARSKVGASGIWQFMRYTARRYLKISRYVDERNDPLKATEAAARMLKSNYEMLGTWPLAITAYNYGPSGLRRLVRQYKTDKIYELIERARHNRFGFASQNFYASFLAAVHVEKNAGLYFDHPKRAKPFKFDSIELDRPIDWNILLSWFGGDKLKAKLYNPYFSSAVTRGAVNIPSGQTVHIIPEMVAEAKRTIASLPKVDETKQYKIRRGDTLSVIAQRFGVSVRQLKEANSLKSAHRIRYGQTLFIP